jgi:geranylgeranyl reductase family protein
MSGQLDVLIVGAGPAGCSAAFDLCRDGLSVLLVDKAAFPRTKPCGGALSIKTLKALRYDVVPVLQRVCHSFKVGLRLKPPAVFPSRYPVAAMTDRAEFDAFCLQRCIDEGAQFQTISTIRSIESTDFGWEVKTANHTLRARFLIGADGANSRVRRLLGLPRPVPHGFAIETCIPSSHATTFVMQMDFGIIDRGYGWIFPKRDHLNVGLFTQRKSLPQASRQLTAYCEARIGCRPEAHFHAAAVPCGGRYGPPACGPNAMLVGDAAGLVDPLLGEGIYHAVRSGQIAADAIRDIIRHGRNTYRWRLREITLDLNGSTVDSHIFYGRINRGYHHLTSLPVRYCLMKGMAVGLNWRQTKQLCLLLPLMKPSRVSERTAAR